MALLREKEFRDWFNKRLTQVQAVQKNEKIGWLARVTQPQKDPWVAYLNSAGRFRSVLQTLDFQLGELLCYAEGLVSAKSSHSDPLIIFDFPMNIPITRTLWSASSQRTRGHYDEYATVYEGIRCRCRRCNTSFVFTAEAQQIAYEVQQKYVWSLPAYCETCGIELIDLQVRNRKLQTQWNLDRQLLKQNKAFITEWLCVLKSMSEFGKGNVSMQTHLARLL